jgi:hypothetical protein
MRNLLLTMVLVLLALPHASVAGDGVIELNLAAMTAGIPSLGDAPGPPLTIGQPGSYILTSDLGVTGVNETVVEITASNVTLDLNGFSVRCFWALTPCKNSAGTGQGIVMDGVDGVTIKNGAVRDMADHGIYWTDGEGMVFESLHVVDNGGYGIASFPPALQGRVTRCTAERNAGTGIAMPPDSIIERSLARFNADAGFFSSSGSLVTENVSSDNGGAGFIVSIGSTVRLNVSTSNTDEGFLLGLELGNNAVIGGSAVGNVAVDNGQRGIDMDSVWGWSGNHLHENNNGNANAQSAGGIQTGTNVCGTNTTCP